MCCHTSYAYLPTRVTPIYLHELCYFPLLANIARSACLAAGLDVCGATGCVCSAFGSSLGCACSASSTRGARGDGGTAFCNALPRTGGIGASTGTHFCRCSEDSISRSVTSGASSSSESPSLFRKRCCVYHIIAIELRNSVA